MDISRITDQVLTERLDAEFYRPIFLDNASRLAGRPNTVKLRDAAIRIKLGYTGPTEHFYDAQGAFYLSSKNIVEGRLIIGGDTDKVSLQAHNGPLQATQVSVGDLLYSRTGTVGKSAVLHDRDNLYNIAAHLIAIRLKTTYDSDYVSTFLNSSVGTLQSKRLQRGTIIQGISVYDLPELLIINLDETSQRYIGEKVRQAERLRQSAHNLENSFQSEIKALYPDIFGPVKAVGKSSRAHAAALDDSLNPGAYNPERLRIRQYVEERQGRRLSSVARIDTPVSDSYQPSDTYVGLDSISSSTCAIAPSTIASGEVEGTVRVLRVGPVVSKLRPYLNKTTYIPRELAGAFGSTELLCVVPFVGVSGWFLYGVLKLESTIRQLNPIATGSTHPRVSRADVSGLMLPWAENQEELGARLESAQQAYFASERLVTTAKFLVEALIDGKVTEAELLYVQQALERGDMMADRELLSRLTRKGIDVPDEPPLFPDLDALYKTLEQVAATDGQNQEV